MWAKSPPKLNIKLTLKACRIQLNSLSLLCNKER